MLCGRLQEAGICLDKQIGTVGRNGGAGIAATEYHDAEAHIAPAVLEKEIGPRTVLEQLGQFPFSL